jgi:hypothetical protein
MLAAGASAAFQRGGSVGQQSALIDYCAEIHGTTQEQSDRWRVADLPGRMGIHLEGTSGPVSPFSSALERRGKGLIFVSNRVLESPLGPDAIAGACARVWFLRHQLRPSKAMVRAGAARLAVPTALIRAIHRGAYRPADVAGSIGCALELVYLRLALDGPRTDDALRERHTAWLEAGLRCLDGRCRWGDTLHDGPRYRDCHEVIYSTPGV